MEISHNIDLFSFNTFGISVQAKNFTRIEKADDLSIAELKKFEHIFILGGGSNILFSKDFEGLVLKVDIKGWEKIKEDEDFVSVQIGAGENWHDIVCQMVEKGWGGLENLSLIPGTVGAAPIQNIGAYGVELKDLIDFVQGVYLADGSSFIIENKDCNFAYRDSIFKNELKGKVLITHVCLKLRKEPKVNISYGAISKILKEKKIDYPSIKDIADTVIEIRQSKLPDPQVLGNAGSFFKNPVLSNEHFQELIMKDPDCPGYPQDGERTKVPAGWLIEKAGWKGKRIGNTGSHAQQALVLVNYGQAKGNEILDLAKKIQDSVYEKFGVELEKEVTVV